MDEKRNTDKENIVKTAFNIGAAFAALNDAPSEKHSIAIVPKGYKVRDLEYLMPNPARKKGSIQAFDADSFVDVINRHSTAATTIYGTLKTGHFTVIFDDHGKDLPGWRNFYAAYNCPLSIEWQTWRGANGKGMRQHEFAKFIEDNLPDILTPAGADMLEISRSLEAKKKVNFAQAQRLDNGQIELTYEEEIKGTAAKGKLQIPEIFTIAIPVLDGDDPYKIDARLRYRIGDDKQLVMWYDLVRPHKVHEDAIKNVWKKIESDLGKKIIHAEPAPV